MSVRKLRIFFAAVSISFFILSCGGGSGGGGGEFENSQSFASQLFSSAPTAAQCADPLTEKKFIYDTMHRYYYWFDRTPILNYADYGSNDELLEALTVPEDKYSDIMTASQYQNYAEARSVGIGAYFALSGGKMFFYFVYPDSPADEAGIRKGYEITAINGTPASEITNGEQLDAALGTAEEGASAVFDYLDYDGVAASATLTIREFETAQVQNVSVFTNPSNEEKIGYFAYNSFGSRNDEEVSAALSYLNGENIGELIVDLRMNPGGLVSTANLFISAFAGNEHTGKETVKVKYNRLFQGEYYIAENTGYDFNPDKIVFIVSGNTASASELLINALKPYKENIYIIGTTTYGKPTGSYMVPFCDYYLVPAVLEVRNARDEGGYFDGMAPDCYRQEDYGLMRDYGDPEEQLISAALEYLETGSCTSQSMPASVRSTKEKIPYKDLLFKRNLF